MLTTSTNPQHRTGFKYTCPMAIYQELDKNYPRYPINLDFYACPKKFAEIHHYVNDERLTAALRKYRTMSAARVNYSYSQNFVDEVIRLCEEYQLGHQFKRRKLNESDDEEEQRESDHKAKLQVETDKGSIGQRSS